MQSIAGRSGNVSERHPARPPDPPSRPRAPRRVGAARPRYCRQLSRYLQHDDRRGRLSADRTRYRAGSCRGRVRSAPLRALMQCSCRPQWKLASSCAPVLPVQEYIGAAGRVEGIRARGRNGDPIIEKATITIGADGRNSLLARAGERTRLPIATVAFLLVLLLLERCGRCCARDPRAARSRHLRVPDERRPVRCLQRVAGGSARAYPRRHRGLVPEHTRLRTFARGAGARGQA